MDYIKIGKFLANERKNKNLTQAKLAEKLFVSEKTISKWENGKGIPDTSILPKLCELFEITINELLTGERSSENNQNQNEQLLLNLSKELEIKNKIIWKSMWIIMTVSLLALLVGSFLIVYFVPKGIWQDLSAIIMAIIFMIPCFYALKLEVSVGAYKCKKCGTEIVPTYSEALASMHMGTTRYLKCPHCNHRTWCKKVLKK